MFSSVFVLAIGFAHGGRNPLRRIGSRRAYAVQRDCGKASRAMRSTLKYLDGSHGKAARMDDAFRCCAVSFVTLPLRFCMFCRHGQQRLRPIRTSPVGKLHPFLACRSCSALGRIKSAYRPSRATAAQSRRVAVTRCAPEPMDRGFILLFLCLNLAGLALQS